MKTMSMGYFTTDIDRLEEENEQLKNNWNELKQFIESELCSKYIHKYDVLDKMNELEGKSE